MSPRFSELVRAAVAGSVVLLAVSGARVRGEVRDDRPGNDGQPAAHTAASIAPARSGGTLQLDLGCGTASVSRLLRLLASDRIKVVWADTGAGGEVTVRITMSADRFKAFFKGSLEEQEVALSASDGYATERFIERYTIPKKYKGSLRWVRLPDPQIE